MNSESPFSFISCQLLKILRYYYQYNKERLITCTSCVHALLHVPLDIQRTGPVWVNWVFTMERACGDLVRNIKSRSKPYVALSRRMLHKAQLANIRLRFGLQGELDFEPQVSEVSDKETVLPECKWVQILTNKSVLILVGDPLSILRFPRILKFVPDPQICRQIAVHLSTQYAKPVNFILEALPLEMESWGKVRIGDGGDCIRTSTSGANKAGRDQSFVRVSFSACELIERTHTSSSMNYLLIFMQVNPNAHQYSKHDASMASSTPSSSSPSPHIPYSPQNPSVA